MRQGDDRVLVPIELTAENGAKSALMGEFVERVLRGCEECDGDDEDCHVCEGTGTYHEEVRVSWTTIKAIWKKGVEHFASMEKAR